MWCEALCPTSVLAPSRPMSSYLGRLSLCCLPQMTFFNSSFTSGRMDSAGFEPASATWTECCVPVTPRALSAVSVTASALARSDRRFLPFACQIGREHRRDRKSETTDWNGVLASIFLCCENRLCRNNGVAVNRHRVLHLARIASSVSHHHWNVSCLTHSEYQLVPALEPIDGQR